MAVEMTVFVTDVLGERSERKIKFKSASHATLKSLKRQCGCGMNQQLSLSATRIDSAKGKKKGGAREDEDFQEIALRVQNQIDGPETRLLSDADVDLLRPRSELRISSSRRATQFVKSQSTLSRAQAANIASKSDEISVDDSSGVELPGEEKKNSSAGSKRGSSRRDRKARGRGPFRVTSFAPVASGGKVLTAFLIEYRDPNSESAEITNLLKRFAQFQELHKDLGSALGKHVLPKLPSKGKTLSKQKVGYVVKRLHKIETFLNECAGASPKSLASAPFMAFLDVSDAAPRDDIMSSKGRQKRRASFYRHDRAKTTRKKTEAEETRDFKRRSVEANQDTVILADKQRAEKKSARINKMRAAAEENKRASLTIIARAEQLARDEAKLHAVKEKKRESQLAGASEAGAFASKESLQAALALEAEKEEAREKERAKRKKDQRKAAKAPARPPREVVVAAEDDSETATGSSNKKNATVAPARPESSALDDLLLDLKDDAAVESDKPTKEPAEKYAEKAESKSASKPKAASLDSLLATDDAQHNQVSRDRLVRETSESESDDQSSAVAPEAPEKSAPSPNVDGKEESAQTAMNDILAILDVPEDGDDNRVSSEADIDVAQTAMDDIMALLDAPEEEIAAAQEQVEEERERLAVERERIREEALLLEQIIKEEQEEEEIMMELAGWRQDAIDAEFERMQLYREESWVRGVMDAERAWRISRVKTRRPQLTACFSQAQAPEGEKPRVLGFVGVPEYGEGPGDRDDPEFRTEEQTGIACVMCGDKEEPLTICNGECGRYVHPYCREDLDSDGNAPRGWLCYDCAGEGEEEDENACVMCGSAEEDDSKTILSCANPECERRVHDLCIGLVSEKGELPVWFCFDCE